MLLILQMSRRRRNRVREEPNAPPEIGDERQEVVNQNWQAIKSYVVNQSRRVYNIRVIGRELADVFRDIQAIFFSESTRFKINFAYAFILYHIETLRFRYFHASANVDSVLETPTAISTLAKFDEFVESIHLETALDLLRNSRPNTKSLPVCLTNVQFYVYPTDGMLIG